MVNEISKRKRKRQSCIQSMKNDKGVTLQNKLDIANCMNKHFSTVGERMAAEFNSQKHNIKDPLSYITKTVENNFYLPRTNTAEIMELILKLLVNKSCGYDLISNRVLKATIETICPHIVYLFNLCIDQGIFPDPLKMAQVIPIFKGGDKEDPSSYRPISLLPAIGKLFEKLISKKLLDFFNKYDLLCKEQFGFRSGFSTEYAIHDIYEKLLRNFDQSQNSCAIFLDLAKAFDSVSHPILLRKLYKYGIRGNAFNLLESYLSNRTQFVKVNNVCSSLAYIKYGVPQGSIIGPLLFLIFINDLPNATNLFMKLFADDTFLCAQNKCLQSLEREVNRELKKVNTWLASNQLTLNISKSKFMLLSNQRKGRYDISIKINGKKLDQCASYKYLGIVFDDKLDWKAHVSYLCQKIAKACGVLAKLRHSVSIELMREIYHALCYSYFKYGIIAWGNAAETILNPIKKLNHRLARIMTFAPFGPIDLRPIMNYLNILDVDDIFLLETSKFIYKKQNDIIQVNIGNYFEILDHNVSNRYYMRSGTDFVERINYRTCYGEKSLQFRAQPLWNDLPEDIINSETLRIFNKRLKIYLLNSQSAMISL